MYYIAVLLLIKIFSVFLPWKCYCQRVDKTLSKFPSMPELLLLYHYNFWFEIGYYRHIEQCVCFSLRFLYYLLVMCYSLY